MGFYDIKRFFAIFLKILTVMILIIPSASAGDAIGLDAFADFRNLCDLRSPQQIRQVSSHDKTGDNKDRSGADVPELYKPYLYENDGFVVLFDEKGPGCVYRMWFTWRGLAPDGDILFYFDGESTPRYRMPAEDFFQGTQHPFLSPLIGGWESTSGGFTSYVPIEYEQSLKIVLTEEPDYYNITYKTYPAGTQLSSLSNQSDLTSSIEWFERAGSNPWNDLPLTTYEDTLSLAAGERHDLTLDQPGTLLAIECDILDATQSDILAFGRDVWLEITWDDRDSSDVVAPFYLFFGGGVYEFAAQALPVGSDPETGVYYCYFPMPFQSSARISLVNRGDRPAKQFRYTLQIDSDVPEGLGRSMGYFHAYYKSNPTQYGRDYLFLETQGTGHVVGCVLETEPSLSNRHLEGDERIYIDGSMTPQVYGTGTEDFFNGGWYFDKGGNFSRAVDGFPYGSIDSEDQTPFICYRFFLTDHLNYSSDIRFGIEHGGDNNIQSVYSSVTFWYGINTPTLNLTDAIDVGDGSDEAAHNLSRTGSFLPDNKSDFYEGDDDDIAISDDGYVGEGGIMFQVTLEPENNGIRLRRRMDYNRPHQQARVFVNDQEVGIWYSAGQNQSKGWRDSDFDIPVLYTWGRTVLDIRLRTLDREWSAYRYEAYSFTPLTDSPVVPVELSCLEATERSDGTVRLVWRTESETNNLGFEIQRAATGQSFSAIGWVDGHNTTFRQQHYQFVDSTPLPGKLRYRLKQVDTDGTISFSEPVVIATSLPEQWTMARNYPNPFNGTTRVVFDLATSLSLEIAIYAVDGRSIRSWPVFHRGAGVYEFEWDGRDQQGQPVASGVYVFKVNDGNTVCSQKMLYLK